MVRYTVDRTGRSRDHSAWALKNGAQGCRSLAASSGRSKLWKR